VRRGPSAADAVTIANGICGFLALAVIGGLIFADDSAGAGLPDETLRICLLLYGLGMVCDVLDGPVARLAGSSGLGSTLDTISDTITFGALPALLLVATNDGSGAQAAVVVAACAYVATTMVRLARHAAAETAARVAAASEGGDIVRGAFRGVPSPVGGNLLLATVILAPPAGVAAAFTAIVALLLVCDIPYPNNASWAGAFVIGLLVASFAAIAGLVALEVPAVIALVGLLAPAVLGYAQRIARGG